MRCFQIDSALPKKYRAGALSGTPVGRKAVTYLFVLEAKKEIILINKTLKKHKAYFFLQIISYLLSPPKVTMLYFLGSALSI